MKYYLIAGETSGDLHGSRLMQALLKHDSEAEFRFWGGDEMQAVGGKLVKHYKEMAVMGVVEVIKKLSTIRKNFRFCEADIARYQPDVLILIDFSGFNLRVAKWAKKNGYKVFYYISPQVWASRSGRVKDIKKYVDRMFVILPFEKDFYKKYDYEVSYVGHPLLDIVQAHPSDINFKTENQLPENKEIIALLPGSRKQEINALLSEMVKLPSLFPDYHFVIAVAPNQSIENYQKHIPVGIKNISLIPNKTYDILQNAKAAIVKSGTSTLETALFRVPQIVCYKANPIFYFIAKRLIKVKYISLVNLILDRPLVKELIQNDFNIRDLEEELKLILDKEKVEGIEVGYRELFTMLGEKGAAERAAREMVDFLIC